VPRFKPVFIQSVSAVTPDFAGIDELWQACLSPPDGFRPGAPGAAAWSELTRAAIRDARAGQNSCAEPCSLILATTKGDIEAQVAWMRAVDGGAAPQRPVPTLATALDHLQSQHGFRPPSFVVSTACASGLAGLIEAALLVQSGDAPAAMALGVDVAGEGGGGAGDFVQDGFAALKALTRSTCRPFDRCRDGLMLGSAAAACVLSPRAAQTSITGAGLSNDATHLTAPDRHAGGLIRAIRSALDSAGLVPAQVDAIVAHGTGTKYNDAMEAVAFRTLFPHRPPITALKGLIGHTLGAAGLIESVVAMRMLSAQIIPPIAGLQTPDDEALNLVTDAPRPARLRHVLKVASGFGGMNAALILSAEGC
jgi:3-oxoacyl-[acyl-carrier-protein] synthase II